MFPSEDSKPVPITPADSFIGERDRFTKLAQLIERAFRPVYLVAIKPLFESVKGCVQVVMSTGTRPLYEIVLLHPNLQLFCIG